MFARCKCIRVANVTSVSLYGDSLHDYIAIRVYCVNAAMYSIARFKQVADVQSRESPISHRGRNCLPVHSRMIHANIAKGNYRARRANVPIYFSSHLSLRTRPLAFTEIRGIRIALWTPPPHRRTFRSRRGAYPTRVRN